MGDRTAISWTDATWNPVRGCSRVSEGCRNCYAEQQAARIVRMGKGKPTPYDGLVRHVVVKQPPDEDGVEYDRREGRWTGAVTLVHQRLSDPMRWRRPRKIFVNSMSDLFHEALPDEHIALVFGVMLIAQQHTYQVLTKRAPRMREWFSRWSVDQCIEVAARYSGPDGRPLPGPQRWNRSARPEWQGVGAWPVPWIWNGVSVENQEAADERIPHLLATPAGLRFLSMEPLLEDVDLRHVQHERMFEVDALTGDHGVWRPLAGRGPGIDWVIAGCESGPRARPCDPAWLRRIRDQCAEAEVKFFLKQAVVGSNGGAWRDPYVSGLGRRARVKDKYAITIGPGSKRKDGGVIEMPYLDGVQHAAFPEQAP